MQKKKLYGYFKRQIKEMHKRWLGLDLEGETWREKLNHF